MKNGEFVVQQEVVLKQERKGNTRLILVLVAIAVISLIGLAAMTGLYIHAKQTKPVHQEKRELKKELKKDEETETCLTTDCVSSSAAIMAPLDATTKPCDDFYQYACGGWIKKAIVPYGKAYITPDTEWNAQMKNILLDILQNSQKKNQYKNDKAVSKAFQFFESCIDEKTINALGPSPLMHLVASLGSSPLFDKDWDENGWSFEDTFSKIKRLCDPWFKLTVSFNPSKVDENIIYLYNGDYRMIPQSKMKEKLLILGVPSDELDEKLDRVYAMLKNIKVGPATNTPVSVKQLVQSTGNKFDFLTILQNTVNRSIDNETKLIVQNLAYCKTVADVLYRTSMGTKADFMMLVLMNKLTPFMSNDISGSKLNRKERQADCVAYLEAVLRLTTSRLLFDYEVFTKQGKDLANEISNNVKEAALKQMEHVKWFDDITKSGAEKKLRALEIDMAYPDEMLDSHKLLEYYNFTVNGSDYFGTMVGIMRYRFQQSVAMYGQPVKKESLFLERRLPLPHHYNPKYHVKKLRMMFPFGKLSPSQFGTTKLRASNYGGIGVAIGHEMYHGLNLKGSTVDHTGSDKQWWSNATTRAAVDKSKCLIEQFNEFEVDGIKENGELTVEENMADSGGIQVAYKAYESWRNQHGDEGRLPGLDLTNHQLFFLAYAQSWCEKLNPNYLRMVLKRRKRGAHSLAKFRLEGTLANFAPFAEAYKCPADSRMNRGEKACHIW